MALTIRNMGERRVPATGADKVLLRYIHEAGIDWMHACGGKGRCTTCKMRILTGGENLSPRTAAEIKFFAAGRLRKEERLACQCRALGDVIVEVPPETQLPHQQYG